MHRGISRLSSKEPSQFFVEASTPTLGSEPTRLQRAVTMGEANAQVDFVDTNPEIKLNLLARKLFFYVVTTMLFYGAFTVIAYIGIPVETIREPVGTSKKAEEKVELYNQYSGYVMAFIETLVGMYMDKFLPVLDVYVHNTFYFLQKATATTDPTTGKVTKSVKISRSTHSAILFAFPIVLMLLLGNSLRGFQAGQEATGFSRVMTSDDLKKEQPTLEKIKESAAQKKLNATALASKPTGDDIKNTILKNAIRQWSTPFTFFSKSPCGGEPNTTDDEIAVDKAARIVPINVHELDSTSAVYGFVPQEWNAEALTTALEPTSSFTVTAQQVIDANDANETLPAPPDFPLATAFEILVQGKLVIERAQGDAATDTYPCWLSDGNMDHDTNATDATEVTDANMTTTTTPVPTTKTPTPTPKPARRLNELSKKLGISPELARQIAMGVNGQGHENTRRHESSRRLQESGGSIADEEDDEEIDDEAIDSDIGTNQWVRDENGVRQCQGAPSSMYDMFGYDDPSLHTLNMLVIGIAGNFDKTIGNLSLDETSVKLEKYEIKPKASEATSQIHIEAMRVTIPINVSIDYGFGDSCDSSESATCESVYSYDGLQESFCGSDGCAFLDISHSMPMQREIGVVPYVVNCTLDAEHVQYSADFRGFYPTDCKPLPNTALLYGIGSYIKGDEYGSNDTAIGRTGEAPYIVNPRRYLRFSFAKVSWQPEALDKKFKAKCGNGKEHPDCQGLWYQLQPSGRYLFAGMDAIPKKLAKADFHSPISLVQLNSPTLFVQSWNRTATLEPLHVANFNRTKWDKKPVPKSTTSAALQGTQCSMLIDSYLRQVNDNQYFIEQPLQVMYTSFFYYLMQNAAVTELNDTSLALNGTLDLNQTAIKLSKGDVLGNVKLKGDQQVRSIRVSIPAGSVHTTLAGCGLILVITLLVILVPARRVEFFDEDASMAQQYLAMTNEETYPDSVHKKTLTFPATGETVKFDELELERMVLVHETERDRKVFL